MSEAEYERWEARYQNEGARLREPSRFVVDAVSLLAVRPGRAVDLGGGAGRNAVWLATRGWDVTLVDISPTALELAQRQAAGSGVQIATQQCDLDADRPEGGPWDLVVVAHYLNRSLLAGISATVGHGGHLVMSHPTIENLTRHDRPPRDYLLQPSELETLIAEAGLDVLHSFEGWTVEDRHEAQIIGQRPGLVRPQRRDQ